MFIVKAKDLIVVIIFLIVLFIIALREFKAIRKKEAETLNSLNHKIIAVLIRHGGKMSCLRICHYLNLPSAIITSRITEMEKKGLIYRKDNDNDEIYLIFKEL